MFNHGVSGKDADVGDIAHTPEQGNTEMARPQRKSGLTGQMSGFASALTQFWDAFDMKSVSGVCKADHRTTEHIWTISAAMLPYQCKSKEGTQDNDARPSPQLTWMQVLRERRGNPLCFAFAQTQSLRRIQASIRMKKRIFMGIDSVTDRAQWSAFDISPGVEEIHLVKRGYETHLDPFTLHQYKQALADAECFADINLRTTRCKFNGVQSTRFLWSILIQAGHLLSFVWWAGCPDIADMWMALDVALTIPLQTILRADPFLGALRRVYKDRIQCIMCDQ
jgi:hypothetical protein